ncbi:hypothetical protein SAMN04489801_4519 [Pseudomonas mandelii]|uniref:Uncharacterized protein n=1 Tax=Pseudomonas mandelii TaxID=75612 RepID=A0ABY0VUZ9_9PSED|nr:hypothetical protein SAMN04489801_4519 [Pseudomonas mandelii]
MSGRDGNEINDPLAALNLPHAVRAQALKLGAPSSRRAPRPRPGARRIAPKGLPWVSKPCAR